MIAFFKDLLTDNYAYCPWNKWIPNWICKKFKLLRVGVWLLNLNSPYILEDVYRYYKLTFTNRSYGNFWLSKNDYKLRINNE